MSQKLKNEFYEFKLLLRSIPSIIIVFFVLSVFAMNLLANKSIALPISWLALDCGIIVSWLAFLAMDIVTKHFGPKAATQLSLMAIAINLVFCLIMFLGSIIPGSWGESYFDGSENIINSALNNTFGGTWYVLLGSTIAFIASSVVNNFSNWGLGLVFKKKPDSFVAYIFRTYISTAIGQFVDNLIFALIVSHFFFGWTLVQCIMCSVTGMVAELLCEVIFSYFGFGICKKWKKEEVGKEYFEFVLQRRKEKDNKKNEENSIQAEN